MIQKEPVNFIALEKRAETMDSQQLHDAIADIFNTLPNADALDRLNGTTNGGVYRDEISVYRRELKKRFKSN